MGLLFNLAKYSGRSPRRTHQEYPRYASIVPAHLSTLEELQHRPPGMGSSSGPTSSHCFRLASALECVAAVIDEAFSPLGNSGAGVSQNPNFHAKSRLQHVNSQDRSALSQGAACRSLHRAPPSPATATSKRISPNLNPRSLRPKSQTLQPQPRMAKSWKPHSSPHLASMGLRAFYHIP